jgi:hypothetical protein
LDPAARASLIHKLADLIRRDVDYLAVRILLYSRIIHFVVEYLEIGNIEWWKSIER